MELHLTQLRTTLPCNTLIDHIYHIVGLCPFGGVILLSTSSHGLHGTFCNDDNFVLPLKKIIYQANILIIWYSMDRNIELEYIYNEPRQPTVISLIHNAKLKFELYKHTLHPSSDHKQQQYG